MEGNEEDMREVLLDRVQAEDRNLEAGHIDSLLVPVLVRVQVHILL
jgi:hypothetical protein